MPLHVYIFSLYILYHTSLPFTVRKSHLASPIRSRASQRHLQASGRVKGCHNQSKHDVTPCSPPTHQVTRLNLISGLVWICSRRERGFNQLGLSRPTCFCVNVILTSTTKALDFKKEFSLIPHHISFFVFQ